MTAYAYPETKSKAELKRRLAAGETFTVVELNPSGQRLVVDEKLAICGPHYPKPHRWYGTAIVKDGQLKEVK